MKNEVDLDYAELVTGVWDKGSRVITRNSPCRRLAVVLAKFSSTPLVSARKTAWKNALREWEWFMSGSNRIEDLHPDVRKWWEPWADEYGVVRSNYGYQFTTPPVWSDDGPTAIQYLLETVRDHPFSRRAVVTTWNHSDMTDPLCKITNCHGTIIQAFVCPDTNKLSLATYQRSADVVLGLPHNWVQYWAFLLWLAHRTGRAVGELAWVGGDVHVYEEPSHEAAVKAIRINAPDCLLTPQFVYTPTSDHFKADDFALDREYRPLPCGPVKMVV
ncbi:MAG: thymidylate synthase [Gemmataceae bacterium]|nr:thymidylate synthase [Gemmataceae bacterium]